MAMSDMLPTRALSTVKYYLSGIYRQAAEKPIFLFAQAIAFKVLITVVPVVFLAVAILGRVLQYPRPFETVSRYVLDFLPTYRSQEIINALDQLQQASNTLTVIGLAGTLIFAMTLFTTLRVVISNIFQEEWHDQRSIIGGYLFDLRMAGQVGLLFLLTIGLTSGLQVFNAAGLETVKSTLEQINLSAPWIQEGWQTVFRIAFYLIPFLLSMAMFFQLFLFIPVPHPPKRSALLGAFTTAVLWEVAKLAFTTYATRAGRFDYSTPETLGSTFGLILAFVFWVYYSGVVLGIGGIVALLHEKRYRLRKKRKQTESLEAQPALPDGAEDVPVEQEAAIEAEGAKRE